MRLASKLICIFLILLPQLASADEFLIDRTSSGKLSIGDFQCSSCPNSNHPVLNLTSGKSGTITAGELWNFFDQQGNSSLNRITLCLDVDHIAEASNIRLNSVELKIEDPNSDGYLTEVGFGENSLLVSGYETASFKPEAKLEVDLGYDFMKTFSSVSTEKVIVNFEIDEAGFANANPVLMVQSSANGFLVDKRTAIFLVIFSLFWIVVFNLVNRFTDPDKKTPTSAKSTSVKTKRPNITTAP